ncbi:MAG TPA: oligosaccharide flippase family protein [Pedobacter sp.]|uniref:oligosaccharide flippase family protein n=1 Tax=Pedobacter sp. TaxID=1411316 RepID=UPI002B7C3E7B|nr:oligosaccharide flippase family protein [Pedobacter sp.]HMI00853.1 oligosaccharide flippase family protein [Pedobacter sp.]
MTNRQSYRQIFKATSLFGAVQVVNVLTGIIRSKFVAIFLGPTGMGVSALLLSSVTLVITVVSLGINFSAVRDISRANESGDKEELNVIVTIFKRWLWVSCIFGTIVLISLSPIISSIAFGDRAYTLSLILLSLMAIFTLLTNGNIALLQGTRKLNYAANSTVIGSLLALFTSIPLYYFYGTKGIVPALIFSAVITFMVTEYFARKVSVSSRNVSRKETVGVGMAMAKLGMVMMLGQILGSVVVYFINLVIRSKGGMADVGLYQAGTMITNQSIGLVFTAMSMDYFPRLSVVSNDSEKVNEMVNQQATITVLIASPLLISLIIFAPIIIHILLSPQFYVISNFVRWLAFGTLFTAPAVVLGYIALAKGDKKSYFLYCTVYNSLFSIFFYLGGYLLNGLDGLAIGMCVFQIAYGIFLSIKFNYLYSFSFNKQFIILFCIIGLFCLCAMISVFLLKGIPGYLLGGVILISSSIYSWRRLDNLIGIKIHIVEKISNFRRK